MIAQVAIAVLGPLGAWMSQDPRPHVARWASIVGLAAAPFWIHEAIVAGQGGILLVSIVYVAVWLRGLVNFWIRPIGAGARDASSRAHPMAEACKAAGAASLAAREAIDGIRRLSIDELEARHRQGLERLGRDRAERDTRNRGASRDG